MKLDCSEHGYYALSLLKKPFGLLPASSVVMLLVGRGCSSTSASRRATQNSDNNDGHRHE